MRDAAAENIALVFPDTSPRGAGVEGEDKDWDFGTGKMHCAVQGLRGTDRIAHDHFSAPRRRILSERNQP
jgi:hypothetical protein